MTLAFCFRQGLSANLADNEFARNIPRAVIEINSFLISSFFRFLPVAASVLTFTLVAQVAMSIDKDLWCGTQIVPDSLVQGQNQTHLIVALALVQLEPWKQFFKTYFFELHYSNFYKKYYNFIQQCENYFKITKVTDTN